MSGWKKIDVGGLPIYQAKTLSWLPGVVQGFTTRHGGVSDVPYDSLNLGAHVADQDKNVLENRRRLLAELNTAPDEVALAEQVHGNRVAVVSRGGEGPVSGADALITNVPNVLLMMWFADCVPVYIVDPVNRVAALVHSGWRGAEGNVVGATINAMVNEFGSNPKSCLAALGPCISAESFEVGWDVASRFRDFPGGTDAGAATIVLPLNELAGKYSVNLRQVVFSQLLETGLRGDYISVCAQDTFRNRRDFFSHRRNGPRTGRMAAYLGFTRKPNQ